MVRIGGRRGWKVCGSREHRVKNLFYPHAQGECRGVSGVARYG